MKFLRYMLGLALALATLWQGTAAHAIEIEFSGKRIKREILALYDSRHEAKPVPIRKWSISFPIPSRPIGSAFTRRRQLRLPPGSNMSEGRG